MITTSLDQIVRRGLLEANLPIHWYAEFLFHATTGLRELSFSTLKIVNSANLKSDSGGNIELPSDFVEDVAVCLPFGQSLKELPKQDWITPLRIHSSDTGAFVPYADLTSNTPQETFCGFPFAGTTWFWNVNAFGEPTGQMYGATGGTSAGYKVFKTQRRIQLTESLAGTNVVLLYISDGQNIDNASQIDPQAFACINAFIEWKRGINRNNKDSAEGRNFYNQMRTLTARLDDLTATDVRNIIHRSYTASIKN